MLSFALLGAEWVLWLLVALSLACLAITIERAIYLLRDATERGRLAAAVNAFLVAGDVDGFRAQLGQLSGYEARILAAGADVARDGAEAADWAMQGTAAAEKLRMERGLSFLAIVGSNAVYIGLFGTVLGILRAFHDLAGTTDATDPKAVYTGISEALVATAVGLVVAISAVIMYNVLQRTVKQRLARSGSLTSLVLARLAKAGEHERPSAVAHGK